MRNIFECLAEAKEDENVEFTWGAGEKWDDYKTFRKVYKERYVWYVENLKGPFYTRTRQSVVDELATFMGNLSISTKDSIRSILDKHDVLSQYNIEKKGEQPPECDHQIVQGICINCGGEACGGQGTYDGTGFSNEKVYVKPPEPQSKLDEAVKEMIDLMEEYTDVNQHLKDQTDFILSRYITEPKIGMPDCGQNDGTSWLDAFEPQQEPSKGMEECIKEIFTRTCWTGSYGTIEKVLQKHWPQEPKGMEIKICTGCGWTSNNKIEEPFLACCPDSNYITAEEMWKLTWKSKRPKKVDHQSVTDRIRTYFVNHGIPFEFNNDIIEILTQSYGEGE